MLRYLLPALLILSACAKKGPEPTTPPAYETADYRTEAPDWLGPGTRLVWDVKGQAGKYQTIVNVKALEPNLQFAWRMPELEKEGGRTIEPAVLDKGAAFNLRLQSASEQPSATTSVWLPRTAFDQLVRTGSAKLTIDDEPVTLQFVSRGPFEVTVGGEARTIPSIHAIGPKGGEYWILANVNHPLLLGIDAFGLESKLTTIKPRD